MAGNNQATMEPALCGLLTDDELTDLGRIKNGLHQIYVIAEAVNALIAENGFPIRQVSDIAARLTANDLARLVAEHGEAEDRIAAAARKATETVTL